MNTDTSSQLVLTATCPDRSGIVGRVSSLLAESRANIVDSQEFADSDSGTFFMRVAFTLETAAEADLRRELEMVAGELGMEHQVHNLERKPKILVMVSRYGHCLNDLLYRERSGNLPAEIAAVVSNHEDLRSVVEWHGVPFHYMPVDAESRQACEAKLLDLAEELDIECVVLARYMQVLSEEACERLRGRAINIHHSLLPAFKGARPYAQAHARGVKVIGATAHYVTGELDEGPIIEQDYARVHHRHSAKDLEALGRDLEARALARAVVAHCEHRVLLQGSKTVVFE